jgi:hypothetical protein
MATIALGAIDIGGHNDALTVETATVTPSLVMRGAPNDLSRTRDALVVYTKS